jgi:type VI secretion system secreted protein Hcp
MAEGCYMKLKARGVEIKGESTVTSMGRENTIECLKFEHLVHTSQEKGAVMATGRRTHTPVVITKRIDKSTPLLYKALVNDEEVDAVIRFFRPNPNGDGTTEQFYTIELQKGRILQIKTLLPNVFDPSTANQPIWEEVSIVYQTIIWTYTNGGITHMDQWKLGFGV